MAEETPQQAPQGCENPLDELVNITAIQSILGKQKAARCKITDAVRQELDDLSDSCKTPEKHEEGVRTVLEALLQKKAKEDFAAEVTSRNLHFVDDVETRVSDDFAEFVSREIWDKQAFRFREPTQWAAFYKKTLRKFFDALVEKAQKSADDNKITFADVNSALNSLDDFHSFYRGRPEAAFATEGILAGNSEAIQQKQGALTSLISEMKGHANFGALAPAVKIEIEGIGAKISSTHSLETLNQYEADLQRLQESHQLKAVPLNEQVETSKKEASETITTLLSEGLELSDEGRKTVEGLKAKLDTASTQEQVKPLRTELDAIVKEYRKQFREAIDELIKVLKPALKAPDGAQTTLSTTAPETPERKEARETVERIEKEIKSETEDLVKLAGFKKELETLRTTYITQKKEVGFWEKTIYTFLLSIGILDIARGFGEKAYRFALDIVTGLANDGAIDDEDALLSHGIVKNQNGLFEVSEVMLPSNDAFLKDRFEISEEGLRKKLLKTKLKDFLQDAVDFENYDTAREAYKDQIGVIKKVIQEKTEEKDRGQTLDTFLKKAGIRSTLIEELSKLNPQPDSD